MKALSQYIRAADYLSAAQIYLRDNYFLTEPLTAAHLKPRLLGHWGTCPGINFTYAHLNRAIIDHDVEMLFVLGPGHGFPAIQANLFIEGTLSKYYPELTRSRVGIEHVAKKFSWPYGFPSHSNPEAPGVILEGGELGYSLGTAYGAILDNPQLIAACLIGDGEAETGALAAAWHINKLIDPTTNGAVLPIIHLNGYKISGPTIYGRMSDEELTNLFHGYGYEPHFVDAYTEEDVHTRMVKVLDDAITSIRFTQHCAHEMTLHEPPRWPMIILRTPKGWNSIKYIGDKRIEDNHYSHQVIAEGAHTDPMQLAQIESWLRSYKFEELFTEEGFIPEIETLIPRAERRMGDNPHTMGGAPAYQPLVLPELPHYSIPSTCHIEDPTCGEVSSMEKIGEYMRDVMRANEANRNFRLMSPDETYSNKLQAVFEVTNRTFVWPHKEWDRNLAWDGRVLEMLSEQSLQGLIQGYVLTGRHAVFASYEAFVQVVASMADQYAKFLSVARTVPWRKTIPSLNYILTSSGWRQEHNGFSHQNPGFIDGVLQRQGCFTNVYFPADANTALAVFKRMLGSEREINVLVCGKRPLPCWRTPEEAERDVMEGISVWDFASDEDPHLVFVGIGDYITKETLAAVSMVRELVPAMRLRFVNITALSALGIGHSQCQVLAHPIEHYFTSDKPVVVNFHGYPQTVKQVFYDYGFTPDRFTIHGYEEVGSTTTPFDMMVRNRTDRYTLTRTAINEACKQGVLSEEEAATLDAQIEQKMVDHVAYIKENGDDPVDIAHWVWPPRSS
jgi:xylulose-5-phosphate/fructose-6-phosphate phosphoketolase